MTSATRAEARPAPAGPVTAPRSYITVYVPRAIKRAARWRAIGLDMDLSAYVRGLIERDLDKTEDSA